MLRKAISAYANQLDDQAKRHVRFASVLRSVAHRLRHILADHPAQTTHAEYGCLGDDGEIHHLDTVAEFNVGPGMKLYKRKVTEWKEIR
jgi:hypothetical protein